MVEHVLRVGPAEHRVEDPAVPEPVLAPERSEVCRRVRLRVERDEVDRDPHARAAGLAAEHVRREAVGEENVVSRRERVRVALSAGGVLAGPVAEPADDPRLALGDPVAHAVAEPGRDHLDVLGERLGRVAYGPAAAVLEGLREVPVVERREGLDAGGEQLVDQPVVEVEAGRVHAPSSFGENARPGDGEAERVEPELSHERDVLGVAVVRVAGDRAVVPAHDLARGWR